MNVYQRLNAAREAFHAIQLKKSGENKFAGYKYFELGDFLIPGLHVFKEAGLCAVVGFLDGVATMKVVNVEKPDEFATFTSPMGSANLKGCHEVQNIGAVETYQRRYLWVMALEIVEHDAVDSSEPVKEEKTKGQLAKTGRITATDGAETLLNAERREAMDDMAAYLVEAHQSGDELGAISAFYNMDNYEHEEEKVYLWKQLGAHSKLRSLLKANRPEAVPA